MSHEEPETVSFEAHRDSAANDPYVRCCRCNKRIYMHDQRCQHCGLNYNGEAWQFSPSTRSANRRYRGIASVLIGAILVVTLILILVFGQL